MKAIALLLLILIISQSTNAAGTCKDYITDEWLDSRYSIELLSADNVVTDNKTGLMWKQCNQGLSGADCTTGTITTHTWKAALDLASTEDFAGFTDWRVPNVEELRSIAAINCFNPAINETAFPNTPSGWYWSSSPVAGGGFNAWIVNFYSGNYLTFGRDINLRVRLVRSGQ
ncbi:hypothetical protein MNBD_GAMMA01-859 [hydrothermal vent metagenome]|uniref:Lcl C-terminal domain-containing protein n=1 Tax=hydrothermal vent metagenome TaxID=652676 RepID=A0A3B0V8P1_9ZZZZ